MRKVFVDATVTVSLVVEMDGENVEVEEVINDMLLEATSDTEGADITDIQNVHVDHVLVTDSK